MSSYRCNNTTSIHPVSIGCSEEVGMHQVGLHYHFPSCTVDRLFDNLLYSGRSYSRSLWQRRLCLSDTLLGIVESVPFGKCLVAIVLDPVVLIVPGIRW
jgi:hypothetical protein